MRMTIRQKIAYTGKGIMTQTITTEITTIKSVATRLLHDYYLIDRQTDRQTE